MMRVQFSHSAQFFNKLKLKTMIIHNLSEEELYLESYESYIDEIWYQYFDYGYDGGGNLIARKGDKYVHYVLGYCYLFIGPTEDICENDFDRIGLSLEEFEKKFSVNREYYETEMKVFFDKIHEKY
jgi:hypothetical protein